MAGQLLDTVVTTQCTLALFGWAGLQWERVHPTMQFPTFPIMGVPSLMYLTYHLQEPRRYPTVSLTCHGLKLIVPVGTTQGNMVTVCYNHS